MVATITTLSPLVRANWDAAPPQSLVFSETDLINWFRSRGRFIAKPGGTPYQWGLVTAENASAEIFVEGQAVPAAGNRTYAAASLAAWYAWVVAQVSGHLRDLAQAGRYYGGDPRQNELTSATKALFNLLETTMLGATSGLPTVIDANDTYAGITVGAVPAWASIETAVGNVLTLLVLSTMWNGLIALGANPSDILSGQTQLQRYLNLTNMGSATIQPVMQGTLPGQTGAPVDLGLRTGTGVFYNGKPWTVVRLMTATELYCLDINTGPFQVSVNRDVQVDQLAKTSDNDPPSLISISAVIEVGRRDLQAKLTGLTSP